MVDTEGKNMYIVEIKIDACCRGRLGLVFEYTAIKKTLTMDKLFFFFFLVNTDMVRLIKTYTSVADRKGENMHINS